MFRFVLSSGIVCLLATSAQASIFVSTGQTGAQVQSDINHSQHWTFGLVADLSDVTGALFTMKRGQNTTESITFVIFEGVYADFGTATNLMSVTLGPSSFTQSFDWVMFAGTPINLLAGHTYTGVLFSNADDPQDEAYFIKGGSDADLHCVDENGNPSEDCPITPAPGALAIFGLAGVAFGARRRSN